MKVFTRFLPILSKQISNNKKMSYMMNNNEDLLKYISCGLLGFTFGFIISDIRNN